MKISPSEQEGVESGVEFTVPNSSEMREQKMMLNLRESLENKMS